jgi:hypothetical protein
MNADQGGRRSSRRRRWQAIERCDDPCMLAAVKTRVSRMDRRFQFFSVTGTAVFVLLLVLLR